MGTPFFVIRRKEARSRSCFILERWPLAPPLSSRTPPTPKDDGGVLISGSYCRRKARRHALRAAARVGCGLGPCKAANPDILTPCGLGVLGPAGVGHPGAGTARASGLCSRLHVAEDGHSRWHKLLHGFRPLLLPLAKRPDPLKAVRPVQQRTIKQCLACYDVSNPIYTNYGPSPRHGWDNRDSDTMREPHHHRVYRPVCLDTSVARYSAYKAVVAS